MTWKKRDAFMKTSEGEPAAPVRSPHESSEVKKDRGGQFPGVRGKVVKWVESEEEEGLLFINVRFTDGTQLAFTSHHLSLNY